MNLIFALESLRLLLKVIQASWASGASILPLTQPQDLPVEQHMWQTLSRFAGRQYATNLQLQNPAANPSTSPRTPTLTDIHNRPKGLKSRFADSAAGRAFSGSWRGAVEGLAEVRTQVVTGATWGRRQEARRGPVPTFWWRGSCSTPRAVPARALRWRRT